MTKADMIKALADKTGMTKADSQRAFDGVFEILKGELGKGERVAVAGFGTFRVSKRAARMGKNPRTGEAIKIPASKSVAFKAGSELKAKVN
ncbi:MAG: HU family DNA-binding protein [Clostridia bacterium]|jgi:DNA-binding protein HU-beta|nr:HU family DNA-binding protein [Clostridia bacterium]